MNENEKMKEWAQDNKNQKWFPITHEFPLGGLILANI
jgi:hypothetical protein